MKKSALIVIIVALTALGLFAFVHKGEAPSAKPGGNGYKINKNGDIAENIEQMSRPWVEVLSATASVKVAGDWEPVNTGDELENGAVVKTDENGLAEIHLPDGSAVRLDSDSEVTLTLGDYDTGSGSLMVRIELAAGRIWSKIIELSTPDSFWQVETANAVAAVRGTSFGVEYMSGETQIIGSENTVEVEAVDPVTKTRLGRIAVTPEKMIRIHRQLIEGIRSKRLTLSSEIKDVPDELRDKPWVSRSALADQIIKRRIEALEARGIERAEIRRIIRADLFEKRRNLLIRLESQGILPRLIAPAPADTTITPAVVAPAVVVPAAVATDTIELLNVR